MSVVRQIGRPNTSILVDAMHLFRSGGTVAELADVDPDLLGYIQLCDAPRIGTGEEYYKEASFERQPPGQGELPAVRDAVRACLQPAGRAGSADARGDRGGGVATARSSASSLQAEPYL